VFDPDLSTVGDGVSINHAFATPGLYRITATFTDVRGVSSSGSTEVNVTGSADTVPPVGTVSINTGATWATSTSVSVAVPATDNIGTVTNVALSNDGVTWTTRAYGPNQAWTLPSSNGPKTVSVKWKGRRRQLVRRSDRQQSRSIRPHRWRRRRRTHS
jgi:hypothetical protein